MHISAKIKGKSLILKQDKEIKFKLDFEHQIGNLEFPFFIEDLDHETMNLITKLKEINFPDGLSLYGRHHLCDDYSWVDIDKSNIDKKIKISISSPIDLRLWEQPFTALDFANIYASQLTVGDFTGESTGTEDSFVYIQSSVIMEGEEVIENAIKRLIEHTEKTYTSTLTKLNSNLKDNILIKIFDFPENYETVCTQYLIWFGDLLNNIGIKANIHTEQTGSKTKIIISPEHADEILKEIEEIFHTYIALPYTEFLPASEASPHSQANYTLLNAQISQFQSQIQMQKAALEMKTAALEMKNEKIKNQSLTIDKQSTELMLLKSLQEDTISIFDGSVSLRSVEWGPFKINPKIIIEKIKQSK